LAVVKAVHYLHQSRNSRVLT